MAETKTNIPVEIKMGNAGTDDANLPAFKEGSIIFTKDTKKIYIDPVGETERIAVGGGGVAVDSEISDTSENPVQNKVIKTALDEKLDKVTTTDTSRRVYAVDSNGTQQMIKVDTDVTADSTNLVINRAIAVALGLKQNALNLKQNNERIMPLFDTTQQMKFAVYDNEKQNIVSLSINGNREMGIWLENTGPKEDRIGVWGIADPVSSATTTVGTPFPDYIINSQAATKGYVDSSIATQVSSVYKAKGSIANLSALPTLSSTADGFVYNIESEFTTTADFVEGAGKTYPAGTNVVCVNTSGSEYKWDVLAGIVDLGAYATTEALTNGLAGKQDIITDETHLTPASIKTPRVAIGEPNDFILLGKVDGENIINLTHMYSGSDTTAKITNIATPTNDNDVANKAYVDIKQDKFASVNVDTIQAITTLTLDGIITNIKNKQGQGILINPITVELFSFNEENATNNSIVPKSYVDTKITQANILNKDNEFTGVNTFKKQFAIQNTEGYFLQYDGTDILIANVISSGKANRLTMTSTGAQFSYFEFGEKSPLKVTGILTPTEDNDAVNKKYVDDLVGDINTILATIVEVTE